MLVERPLASVYENAFEPAPSAVPNVMSSPLPSDQVSGPSRRAPSMPQRVNEARNEAVPSAPDPVREAVTMPPPGQAKRVAVAEAESATKREPPLPSRAAFSAFAFFRVGT